MAWAKLKISKINLVAPESESVLLGKILATCGFIADGIFWPANSVGQRGLRFFKKLVYDTINFDEAIDFVARLFLSWGYEVREEQDGLTYRLKSDGMSPFFSMPWHRIHMVGGQIVVSPPARPLDAYELETLFFPLVVKCPDESPLLVTIGRKRAPAMIELPNTKTQHDFLFEKQDNRYSLLGRDLVYTFPSGFQKIRRGLPILFYVNRIGAVGQARIKTWSFEDASSLCKVLQNDQNFDIADFQEHVELSGSRMGKVLVLRHEFHRVFKNAVPIKAMRAIDKSFNPQRQRAISYKFLEQVTEKGVL